MHYKSGSTGVSTTAAEAWHTRQGVCQDFSHVLLALSRLAGVPARYVSGFLPGEGAMHAWAEVRLAAPGGASGDTRPRWYAVDPTHDAWVTERYVSIAVGRDYRDITPNSGTYYGRAQNVLRHRSRVQMLNTVTESV
jgi:transglutaminase-like putative cysteine protease